MRHALLGRHAAALPATLLAATLVTLPVALVGCKSPSHHGRPEASAATPVAPANPLDEVVPLMAGSFSSAEQAAADHEYFDIRLHMTPIWPGADDGRWLYVEQARGDMLDKPYRQRIYHVVAQQDGSVVSEVYELPGDPLAYAGAWNDTTKLAPLTPQKITRKDGCGVRMRRTAPGVFEGGTDGHGCVSNLRGASYATSTVHADAEGLVTWDRGYNAAGEQVWGAVKGGYHFKRQP